MNRILFHASPIAGLTMLKVARKRTPGKEQDPPEGVYASHNPAYCLSHGFDWSSHEGVELSADDWSGVVLLVPRALHERMQAPVTLYVVAAEQFLPLPQIIPYGYNFRALEDVPVLGSLTFRSVADGFAALGGHLHIKDSLASRRGL